MLCRLIFATFFVAICGNFQYATDDLEKFLLEAIKNNESLDYDYYKYGKPCETFEPIKPEFTAPGRRISEAKCYEYVWEMEKRENETEWSDLCRLYLISEIKKGVVPEIFFVIQSPVIFGGRPADPGEFPHMGAIGWKAKDPSRKWVFKCGSTLISKNFLITAAHCSKVSLRRNPDVVKKEPEIVRLGVENIDDKEFTVRGYPDDLMIKRFIIHPKYTPPRKYNDIALIELEGEVKFASNIHPACLWSGNDISELGNEASLTGWGLTEKGSESAQLQTAVVDFLETKNCETILSSYHNRNWRGFQEHQMCAGKLDGGIDTCQGDSGGPLQVQIPLTTEGKMYWIAGVTSFGIKCGQRNRPGVYTRVPNFIDWIEKNVWG